MKRVQMLVLVLLVAGLAFQGLALAKEVSGKVAGIDTATNKLTLAVADAAAGTETKSDIWINKDAAYTGVASLAELKEGDSVTVSAEADEQGNWKAGKVTKA